MIEGRQEGKNARGRQRLEADYSGHWMKRFAEDRQVWCVYGLMIKETENDVSGKRTNV